MAEGNLNLEVGCESCTHSDWCGRGCAHGLLFPVLVFMAGYDECPNFEKKTIEQLKEQYEHQRKERQGATC